VASEVRGTIGKKTRTVTQVYLAETASLDVALLRLTAPVAATPPRVGHPKLVRIGDRVWVASPDNLSVLFPGIVDKFELFPEQNLHVFKLGIRLPAECSGGTVFNDIGEVVGILTIRDNSGSGVFATDGRPQNQ
jgi:molecular chaperone DnaK